MPRSASSAGGIHAAVRFDDPVAVRLDGMRQPAGLQGVRGRRGKHRPVARDRLLHELHGLAVGGGVPQSLEEVLAAERVVRGDGVRDPVEVDPLNHPGQAQRMVAVEVCDADPVDVVGCDPSPQHLPLGALAGVEEDALAVPAQQIAVVVSVPGGNLAGGAEHHQFTYGHG